MRQCGEALLVRRLQDGPREAAMVTGHCQDFFVSIDMSLCPTFVPELDRTSPRPHIGLLNP